MNSQREKPCCSVRNATSWVAGVVAICAGMLVMVSQAASHGSQKVKPYESGIVWAEPKMVTPGTCGSPPSDAIVLFDGKNMDAWTVGRTKWTLENGVGTAKSDASTK